jgi:hypothetical protein
MASFRETVRLLTLPCEEITRLVSESLDGDLPWVQRWALRIHFLYCKACRRFKRQARFLGQALRRMAGEPDGPGEPNLALSPEARRRIRQSLEET